MAPTGLLTIDGVIRLSQFWAQGKSDGDTVKITIPKGINNAFKFAKRPAGAAKVITQPRGKANAGVRQVTIRMQGIDTPELHYKIYDGRTIVQIPKANRKVNIEYYQHLAGSAALALHRLVRAVGTADEIPC